MRAIKKPPKVNYKKRTKEGREETRRNLKARPKKKSQTPPKKQEERCQAAKENGEQCGAAAMKNKIYCAAHDPDFDLSKRGVLSKAVKNQSLWLIQKAKAKFLDEMKTWEGHGVMVRALCADILQSEIISPADKALLLKEAIKLNQKYLESTKGKQAEEIKIVIKQIENEAAYIAPQQERPEPGGFKDE